jgi:hypothetical protein
MNRHLPDGDSMADHYCDRCAEAWRDCTCEQSATCPGCGDWFASEEELVRHECEIPSPF